MRSPGGDAVRLILRELTQAVGAGQVAAVGITGQAPTLLLLDRNAEPIDLAIAMGLCDGLVQAGRAEAMYNTKSALFTQGLAEMARIARTVRARAETVYGLGAAGDLHVTGMPGRNRIFGELRGAGRPTAQVVETLRARDELTEGYAAIHWCWRYARERNVREVPLLRGLHRIVYEGREVEGELRAACFDRGAHPGREGDA